MQFDPRLVLTDDAPRMPYQSNSSTASFDHPLLKGLHYGQRKLFLSEMTFLTAIVAGARHRGDTEASKKYLVVYAGAACGLHLPFLFSLFPQFDFILIDPAPFCAAVKEIASRPESCVLELIEDICTPELCLRLRRTYGETHDIFLVSDIRSGQPTSMNKNQEHTDMIVQDNAAQREWCFSLGVEAAMLKFHPPYPATQDPKCRTRTEGDTTPEDYQYLDGTRLLGVWAPKSSSEVRLVVSGPFKRGFVALNRNYSCTEHEEQCYAYNVTGRYEKDCAAERIILRTYVDAFPDTFKTAEELSKTLSEELGYPLFCPLEPGFTEWHARWLTLLYSTGKRASLELFVAWKDEMTLSRVTELVTTYKDSTEMPKHAEVAGTELTPAFWKVFSAGDFGSSYCLPGIRWAWLRSSPQRGAPSNLGRQPGDAGKKRTRALS